MRADLSECHDSAAALFVSRDEEHLTSHIPIISTSLSNSEIYCFINDPIFNNRDLTRALKCCILSNMQAKDANLDETALVNSLRQRDETAFAQLIDQYHPSLVRLASIYLQDTTTAEEVAQETWLALLHGLDQFEGRSSLKTWIFTILTNKAKTRNQREKRTVSYTDLEASFPDQPTVDPHRFRDPSADSWPNHWAPGSAPVSWSGIPEEAFLSQETMQLIRNTIDSLPENQRLVMTLHDQDELSTQEICNILGISETNQRVLLHRARARVRQALENYLQLEH